jgi:hypothetical protein
MLCLRSLLMVVSVTTDGPPTWPGAGFTVLVASAFAASKLPLTSLVGMPGACCFTYLPTKECVCVCFLLVALELFISSFQVSGSLYCI